MLVLRLGMGTCAQMLSIHTSVFALVSMSTCTVSGCAFPFFLPLLGVLLHQKPSWSSHFSLHGKKFLQHLLLPLCPYDIKLWSLITRSDSWYPMAQLIGLRAVHLHYCGQSLAIPGHGPDPHLAQTFIRGGQRGTCIPADASDAPGTKESVGSSWLCQLLLWKLAPLTSS